MEFEVTYIIFCRGPWLVVLAQLKKATGLVCHLLFVGGVDGREGGLSVRRVLIRGFTVWQGMAVLPKNAR